MNVIAPQWSEAIVEHAKNFARRAGRTYLCRTGSFKKAAWAESLLRKLRIEQGLVGILCTLETCNSFTLQVYANGHNWLTQQLRRLGFVIKDNAFTQLDGRPG
jgi:hypothetical protein